MRHTFIQLIPIIISVIIFLCKTTLCVIINDFGFIRYRLLVIEIKKKNSVVSVVKLFINKIRSKFGNEMGSKITHEFVILVWSRSKVSLDYDTIREVLGDSYLIYYSFLYIINFKKRKVLSEIFIVFIFVYINLDQKVLHYL